MELATPSLLPIPSLEGGSPIYLTGEELLKLSVVNSGAGVTVTLTGRFLPTRQRDEGPDPRVVTFRHDLIPATNRTVSTKTAQLGNGWLLDWQINASAGAPSHGQTWAVLTLVRGSQTTLQDASLLGKGYVTANVRIGNYGATFADMTDGAGFLRSITGTTPAAGADISEVVPTGARWELIAFFFKLTTAVAVANRDTTLTLDDGANQYFSSNMNVNQAASLTFTFNYIQGFGAAQISQINALQAPIPQNNRLGAGHRIKTSTASIQAADQYTAPQYLVREWLEVN